MFEKLPKPIFYKIFEEFKSKDIHRLMFVSKHFYQMLKSEDFWKPKINIIKQNLQKRHPDVSDLDASLAAAAYLGLTHIVEKYIIESANVNVRLYLHKNENMYICPVHFAALSGNLACVKLLISAKAIFIPTSAFQDTPLHWAVSGGRVNCAKYFLDNGVKVDHESGFSPLGWNWTALQIAANVGSVECCELLIGRGAFVQKQDPDQYQAIHRAALSGSVECVRLLAQQNADVDASNEDGITPLDLAVSRKHALCVQELLRLGANPRTGNWLAGFTLPLQIAIDNNDLDSAKVLLADDPSLIDAVYQKEGSTFPRGDKTALHIAAAKGNARAVQLLMQFNADPTLTCKKGKDAVDYVNESDSEECQELVKNYFNAWQMQYSPIM